MTELIGDIKYAIGLDFLLEGGDNLLYDKSLRGFGLFHSLCQ